MLILASLREIKARRLFEAGCRSLEDLRKSEYASTLTKISTTALDYVDEIEKRITREQVDAVKVSISECFSRTHVE